MSTLTVTNVNTGSNSTPLNIATGGTFGGSIKLESANSNIIMSGNVSMANAFIGGTNITPFDSGYKNKIINGNFDIWQRGTSNGMSGYYTADRWKSSNIGTTKIASQQSFTVGQTDVPGEPTYFMRHVVTSSAGAGNYSINHQMIENVRTLAGKTVTFSFYAKADSSKNIAIEFYQEFGSGGSPSTAVTAFVTTCALTSSWKKFIVTGSIPSISGKTLGSNNDHTLRAYFWFDAGSTYNSRTNSLGQQSGTFDIAQVQLEEGPVATAFEQRHIGQELELCRRYYMTTSDQFSMYGTTGWGYISLGPDISNMRAVPTATYTTSGNVNISLAQASAAATCLIYNCQGTVLGNIYTVFTVKLDVEL